MASKSNTARPGTGVQAVGPSMSVRETLSARQAGDFPLPVFVKVLLHQQQADGNYGRIIEKPDDGDEIGDDVEGIQHVQKGKGDDGDRPARDLLVCARFVIADDRHQQLG